MKDTGIWKEVFRAGVHTDAAGNEREWTGDDLDQIAHKYNSQLPDEKHEAPVVVGHPVSNSPSYGWVEELKREGDILLARFVQLDPEFQVLIEAGRYKKVSIALYPDMMLRHVGYLGAVPPAVKGLKDTEFADGRTFIFFEQCNITDCKTGVKYPDNKDNTTLGINNLYLSDTQSSILSSTLSDALGENEIKKADKNNNCKTDVKALNIQEDAKLGINNLYLNDTQSSTQSDTLGKETKDKEKFSPYNPLLKEKEKKENNIYSLSKFQNHNGGNKNLITHKNLTNFLGGEMPEEYSKLFQDLMSWLGQTFNEEVANQTAAEIENLKNKYLSSQDTATGQKPGEHSDNTLSGIEITRTKDFMELQRKMESLERDNRDMKFNEYFASQSGKLVPAQKTIVKAAFEFANSAKTGFEFSENGKTIKATGEEIIKRLIESFPNQVEFSEIARKEFYEGGNSLDEQNKAIDEYYKGR